MGACKGCMRGRQSRKVQGWLLAATWLPLLWSSLPFASGASTCRMVVKGNGAGGITAASMACSGDPANINTAATQLLQPFASGFTGVRLAANGSCGDISCLITICGSQQVTITDSSLTDVRLPQLDAVLCVGGSAQVMVMGSELSGNTCANSSMVVQDTAKITVHSSRVLRNQGTNEVYPGSSIGGGLHLRGRAIGTVTANSLFAHNHAIEGGGAYLLENATLLVNGNSVFHNNTATMTPNGRGGIGGAIGSEGPTVLIVAGNATFTENTGAAGGAIGYGYSDTATATIANANFVNNRVISHFGGALWFQGPHRASIVNTSFVGNKALGVTGTGEIDLGSGAVMLAEMGASVNMSNCLVRDSLSTALGGGIRLKNSDINVDNCTFVNNTALTQGAGGVQCSGGSRCSFRNSVFRDHVTSGPGGVFMLSGAFHVLVDNCTITNNSATSGGAIYGEALYMSPDLYELNITNSEVTRNNASWGGGLDITAGGKVLLNNTRIMDNLATIGGGIAYLSSCRKLNVSCANELAIDPSTFIAGNSAQQGGGIYIEDADGSQMDVAIASAIAQNNTAFVGPNVAITPTKTSFIGRAPPAFTEFSSRSARDSGLLPVMVRVTNRGGVGIQSVRIQAAVTPGDGTILTGSVRVSDASGIANFTDLKLRAPAGDYKVVMTALDYPALPALVFPVTVRKCRLGEVTSPQSDTCEPCPASYFSLSPGNVTCDMCLKNAICPGGSVIAPDIGFWHSAWNSTQLHACPNPTACLGPRNRMYACFDDGNVPSGNTAEVANNRLCSAYPDPDLQCSEGYTGSVCGKCMRAPVRYGMKTPFNCGACLPALTTIILFALALLVLLLLMAVTVQSNWADNQHPKVSMDASDVLKVLIRYIQYIVIIGSLKIGWPNTLAVPLKAVSWLYASGSSQAVSLDCAFEDDPELPLAIKRILVFIVVPAVALVVLLLVQVGMWAYARVKQVDAGSIACWLRERLPVIVLVTVFYFFPALVRVGLGMFACLTVDEPNEGMYPNNAVALGSYWVYDMDRQCWSGWHQSWALGVGVTYTLVFVGLVPIGIAAFMLMNRSRVDDPSFRRHFGFLYCNYRAKFCYYEAFASVQTAALVAVDVFGYVVGLYYTVLLLTSVMVIIIVAQAICKPFAFKRVHSLQLLANGCVCLTAFASLSFFSFDRAPGHIYKEVMGALVLAANFSCVVLLAAACISLLYASPRVVTMRRKLSKSFSGLGSSLRRTRSGGRSDNGRGSSDGDDSPIAGAGDPLKPVDEEAARDTSDGDQDTSDEAIDILEGVVIKTDANGSKDVDAVPRGVAVRGDSSDIVRDKVISSSAGSGLCDAKGSTNGGADDSAGASGHGNKDIAVAPGAAKDGGPNDKDGTQT